ncbi:hypothetical protein [Alteromonas sp. 14N.309.X.WAT.G.H12]|uniref:hypothetical protein n=1 Tax=Alteromonas sp. 14N.309.X.WAT.G.H12 TaxID=3120824 RepID=UPI002FD2CB9D
MRLFFIGIISIFATLYINAVSDPLHVKSTASTYLGFEPYDGFAAMNKDWVDDIDIVERETGESEFTQVAHFQHVSNALISVSSDINNFCLRQAHHLNAEPLEAQEMCHSQ